MSYTINVNMLKFLDIEDKEYTADELIKILMNKNQINNNQELKTPANISNELADFIGIKHDDKISMIDVKDKIYKYIDDNHLSDGHTINVDDKLYKLFKCNMLTYFNLQKYICYHIKY